MFCPNCGKEIPKGAKFCTECGAPVPDSVENNGNGGNVPPADPAQAGQQPEPAQQPQPVQQPQAGQQSQAVQQPQSTQQPQPAQQPLGGQQYQQMQQPQPVQQPQVQQGTPKKSGSKVPIIIAVVAVVVVCIIGAVMLLGGSDSGSSATSSNGVTELSQYLGYTEEEIAAELGVEVNPEGAYPSLENCNFMCTDTVEMIYIDSKNEGDDKYSLFGITLGTKEKDISKILGSDFEYSETNSYDIDGESLLWYDDVKTGGILMINCEDSEVTAVSYFSGDAMQAVADNDMAFFGLEDEGDLSGSSGAAVEDEAYMEYVKNFLSDFNEVRAADMDEFTDAELLDIYNELIDRIARVDTENIGIDGMRSILSTSELQIMSEQTAENLPDNVILDLYEELCEHENDTDGTWFAEMRELYGLSSGDYILPDSDSRYLSASDLAGLTKDELRIARNEIYARHGRMFDSADLDEYFNSKSWYNGTIPAASFSENMLNDYEKKNAELIKSVEDGGSTSGTPVANMSKSFDTLSIFGTYKMHDSNRGIDIYAETYVATGDGYDYIHFYSPWHDSDNIFTGSMEHVGGNVYVASGDPGSVRLTFGDDGAMLVEVVNDFENRLDVISGVFDQESWFDVTKVG